VDDSPDWDSLTRDPEPWVTAHGLLMVVAGSAFGVAVVLDLAFAGMGLSLIIRRGSRQAAWSAEVPDPAP
jgi:hypothetical protein